MPVSPETSWSKVYVGVVHTDDCTPLVFSD